MRWCGGFGDAGARVVEMMSRLRRNRAAWVKEWKATCVKPPNEKQITGVSRVEGLEGLEVGKGLRDASGRSRLVVASKTSKRIVMFPDTPKLRSDVLAPQRPAASLAPAHLHRHRKCQTPHRLSYMVKQERMSRMRLLHAQGRRDSRLPHAV